MARYARSEPFFTIMTGIVVGFVILGFGAGIAARGSGFDIVTFAMLYALGLAKRSDAPVDKRLMVLAGVMMMDPAVARAAIFIVGFAPLTLLIELAILGAFPIYDWRTRGRPHWASMFGVVLFAVCFALRMALAGSEAWAGFAVWFF